MRPKLFLNHMLSKSHTKVQKKNTISYFIRGRFILYIYNQFPKFIYR